jgi:hypothetical protein
MAFKEKNMKEYLSGQNSTWKNHEIPRGKHHNKTETKTTVSLYLSKTVVGMARKRGLNTSRITEQALTSILDYINAQNNETRSNLLSQGSFQKETWWTGIDEYFRLNLSKSSRDY